jgi:hypothetical protein
MAISPTAKSLGLGDSIVDKLSATVEAFVLGSIAVHICPVCVKERQVELKPDEVPWSG